MNNNNISIVECITATLRDEILGGQYRPGERLPSERDLATRFEANRGAIREALKKLEQLGIASINPGGVRVVPIEEASLSILGPLLDLQEIPDATLLGHFLEVMGLLISMSARTAIEKANDEEIEQMLTIVGRIISSRAAEQDREENWNELGALFARINNNLVLRLIINGLKSQFMGRREKPPGFKVNFDQQKSMRVLKQLESGLSQRDSKRVAVAINDYFQLIIETVQSALAATRVQFRSTVNE